MSDILVGVALGLVIAAVVGLALLVYQLAQSKVFFTSPKEGTVEFVMAGNSIRNMILVWKGHQKHGVPKPDDAFAEYEVEVSPSNQPQRLTGRRALNPLNWGESFGIYWVGLWPFYKIYRYDFFWVEEKIDEGTNQLVPFARKATKEDNGGQTPFAYVNDFNYVFFVNDVKTKDGVPLKLSFIVTIRLVNPYKALFLGEDWLQRAGGAISLMTIRYAGVLSYEEIIANKPAPIPIIDSRTGGIIETPHTLEDLIKMLADGQPHGGLDHDLLTEYGVRIVAAKTNAIDFADGTAAAEYSKATTQRYVAEQKGQAELAEARGKAEAIGVLAEAERNRIETAYSPIAGTDKDARMRIRQLEALEKSGEKGGHTIVIPDNILGLAGHLINK